MNEYEEKAVGEAAPKGEARCYEGLEGRSLEYQSLPLSIARAPLAQPCADQSLQPDPPFPLIPLLNFH